MDVPAGVSVGFSCKRRPNSLVAGTTGADCTLVKNVNYGNGSHEWFLAGGWSPYQLDGSIAFYFLGVSPERMRDDGSGALTTLKLPTANSKLGQLLSHMLSSVCFVYTLTLPLFLCFLLSMSVNKTKYN